jgi:hypothetical protein
MAFMSPSSNRGFTVAVTTRDFHPLPYSPLFINRNSRHLKALTKILSKIKAQPYHAIMSESIGENKVSSYDLINPLKLEELT